MTVPPKKFSRRYRFHPAIWGVLLVLFVTGLRPVLASDVVAPSLAGSEWIWYPEGSPDTSAPQASRWFRKTFELPLGVSVKRATLVSTCDDAQEVFLNGEAVGSSASWNEVTAWDVTGQIQRLKKNVLAVRGTNAGPSPAGLLAVLEIELSDGTVMKIPTDATWLAAKEEDALWLLPEGGQTENWQPALAMHAAGRGPWAAQPWMGLPPNDAIPDDFVRIEVPGFEAEMELWRELYWKYYGPAPLGGVSTIWDALMPVPVLTPAVQQGGRLERSRAAWKKTLETDRTLDAAGYVSQDQHYSLAHPLGWPFPSWVVMPDGTHIIGKTTGWHFFNRGRGAIYDWLFPAFEAQKRIGEGAVEGWQLEGLESLGGETDGRWKLKVTGPRPTLTAPGHGMPIEAFCSPFLQIRHRAPAGMAPEATIAVRWQNGDQPGFSPDREVRTSALGHNPWVSEGGDQLCLAPMFEHASWQGTISGLQFEFEGFREGDILEIDSIFTTFDTRTPASNGAFLLGCSDYFRLTHDLDFLRKQLPVMRRALRYAREELGANEHGLINPGWVGQDGRSGYTTEDGKTRILQIGHGVGMDIIPYGHDDLYSTNFYFGGLSGMIELEEAIERNPDWKLPAPEPGADAASLRKHAEFVRKTVQEHLFNAETGRFGGARDDLGKLHDYGHTMVNLDAVYYGLAEAGTARSIMDWLAGNRVVKSDTAQGEDIYRWEFAPRFGTLRNADWWSWLWDGLNHDYNAQCQDGGTWFSISAQDIINRARVLGGDNAWERVKEILVWYERVKAAGGFRSYYDDPSKGTLQGGGTAGALGLDNEFVENVRAPYAVIEGILGYRLTPDGLEILPHLPTSWPSARVTGLAFRDQILTVEILPNRITLEATGGTPQTFRIVLPADFKEAASTVTLKPGSSLTFDRKTQSVPQP